MKKKKILLGGLIAAAIFALSSCGNDEATGSNTNISTTHVETTPTTAKPSTAPESTTPKPSKDPNATETFTALFDVENDIDENLKGLKSNTNVGLFEVTKDTVIRGRIKDFTDPVTGETATFNRSVKVIGEQKIICHSTGKGSLTFYIQNSSTSSDTNAITVSLNGSPVRICTLPGSAKSPDTFCNLDKYNSGSPVVKITIPMRAAGDYEIVSAGATFDVFNVSMEITAKVSDVEAIEVKREGTTEYVEGQTFSKNGLVVYSVYGNGKREVLDNSLVIPDVTDVKFGTPGKYNVHLKYENFKPVDLPIEVYEFMDTEIGKDMDEELSTKSSVGDTIFYNHSLREVYMKGEDLSTNALTALAIGKSTSGVVKPFILKDNYTVDKSVYKKDTVGNYDIPVAVTLNGKTKSNSFKVSVVDAQPSFVGDEIHLKVDKSYAGVIGGIDDGANTFNTIQQAIDYLNKLDSKYNDTVKQLVIGEGLFTEKLEIEVPNLVIYGAGKDKTTIEWDSLYGIPDASGFMQNRDSSTSVAVRESAVNCSIFGLTISNRYNSQKVFDDEFGKNYGEHRALALLVMSDKFTMHDCCLLGFQDTVEFFKGRQLVTNTLICGTTDFIFGTNNTTYFNNCEIRSIYNSNGSGYTTAFMGNNEAGYGAVKYGAIFDHCVYTAEEGVESGSISLGRPWGQYAAVAIMNSTIGSHISKKPYNGASAGERYISMGNQNPNTPTVRFVEYNNNGSGAVTEEVNGMKLLSASEAAEYSDFSKIFGKTNGEITYSDAWVLVM